MRTKTILSFAISGLTASFLHASNANAMPDTLNWTAYGTGTSGHAQIMAISQLLQEEYGTQITRNSW